MGNMRSFLNTLLSKVSSSEAVGSRAHEIQTTSRNCTNIVLFAEKPASVKQKSPISRQTGHLNTSICIDEGKSCVLKYEHISTQALRTQKTRRVG